MGCAYVLQTSVRIYGNSRMEIQPWIRTYHKLFPLLVWSAILIRENSLSSFIPSIFIKWNYSCFELHGCFSARKVYVKYLFYTWGIRLTEEYQIYFMPLPTIFVFKKPQTAKGSYTPTCHNLFKARANMAKLSSIFIRISATFAPSRLVYLYVGTPKKPLPFW
jgi:hypothetical protein